MFLKLKKQTPKSPLYVRAVLFSQAVASQVFSPLMSLTTVFGMGTGVPSSPLTRTILSRFRVSHFCYDTISAPICQYQDGDPWGNRTPVCGVRGRRLNRLTNGPFSACFYSIRPAPPWDCLFRRVPQRTVSGTPSRARTVDPLIKSQLLYQLS